MHRRTLGDFELSILSDGTYMNDGGAMFGIIPKVMWEKRLSADDRNRVPLGLNSLLVRTGKHNVLIETGIGNKLTEKRRAIYDNQELLLKSFAGAAVSPDEIDIVINTHLHFDHCGWNTYYKNGKPVPTFPRARYYVQEGELQHAHEQHERDRVSYVTDNYDPLVASGQMQLLRGDAEIVPGISVKVYPGHTRDLQAVMIRSGGRVACYPSDLVPDTHHLEPIWILGYDLYPMESIANKHRFYELAIPDHWLVVFTHDTTIPWAYLEVGPKGNPIVRAAEAQGEPVSLRP
jgi:glyoxylase-like metal-dependent hydrolase (beta-lactamase superfamily II)